MIVYAIDLDLKARVGILVTVRGRGKFFRYKLSACSQCDWRGKMMSRYGSRAHEALRRAISNYYRSHLYSDQFK